MPAATHHQQSAVTRRLLGIIVFSFLITFAVARFFVYLVLGHLMPNFFLEIRGVHVHHFTYGVVLLAGVGLYFILKRPELGSRALRWSTFIYGVGLGLTFDEFGMWVRLEDSYWVRQSYDAMVIITLIFLNIAYYRSVAKWLKEVRYELLGRPVQPVAGSEKLD